MDLAMRDCFAGPMPVRDFLDEFLPVQLSESRRARLPGFGVMARIKKEEKMYAAFSRIANSICTTIRAFNTSNKPLNEDGKKEEPDISFYDANTSGSADPLTSFQRMEMFVEFKCGEGSEPFDDEAYVWHESEELFENTCNTRRHIVACAICMQVYQFRTCAFSVGIFGKVARLFRWDRAGAVFSELIPYCAGGNRDLSEFFYRFDLMDRARRGWDPTVSDATLEEAASFDAAVKAAIGEKKNSSFKSLLDSTGNKNRYPRKRVEIDGEEGRAVSYIVGRPVVKDKSPTGRGTRGFVALSMDTNKLVFLKDSWRMDSEVSLEEAHWFGKLKGVRNISAFLQGSDVGRVVAERRYVTGTENPSLDSLQRTVTNLRWEDCSWPHREMMGYIHYRTVQCELYVPLNTFRDSKHLTQIIRDVVIALNDLSEVGILHRDISEANIMISADGRGRLIDFDLAWNREYAGKRQSAAGVGTWRFMSTQLLFKPGKVRELRDDLESLWFVLLFEALHFVKHNAPDGINMVTIFDSEKVSPWDMTITGGVGKAALYHSGNGLMNRVLEFDSKPFTDLIRKIHQLFGTLFEYYIAQDREETPKSHVEENARKVESCTEIERLLEEALDSEEWPVVCDKVEDQYPSASESARQRKDETALSCENPSPVPSGVSSGLKRKREEDVPPVSGEVKRAKRVSLRLRLRKSKHKG